MVIENKNLNNKIINLLKVMHFELLNTYNLCIRQLEVHLCLLVFVEV